MSLSTEELQLSVIEEQKKLWPDFYPAQIYLQGTDSTLKTAPLKVNGKPVTHPGLYFIAPNMRYTPRLPTKAAKVLGILNILFGIALIILGAFAIITKTQMTIIPVGLVVGVLAFIAGKYSLKASKEPNNSCAVTAALILATLSTIFAIIGLCVAVQGLAVDIGRIEYCKNVDAVNGPTAVPTDTIKNLQNMAFDKKCDVDIFDQNYKLTDDMVMIIWVIIDALSIVFFIGLVICSAITGGIACGQVCCYKEDAPPDSFMVYIPGKGERESESKEIIQPIIVRTYCPSCETQARTSL